MSEKISDSQIRLAVVRLLEEKGYKVTDAASGSGVPKFSRIKIEKGAERLSCAVKTTGGGRISFTRKPDGTYKVLGDVDRVMHARLIQSDVVKVRISMFERPVVEKAFEDNHVALEKRGMGHIPLWVNPEHEDGWRMTGSGFQKDALWSETISITLPVASDPTPKMPGTAVPSPAPSQEVGIMDRIKAMLSEHMGVRPELIEIDVRVKL
jgi:hypothetical protein